MTIKDDYFVTFGGKKTLSADNFINIKEKLSQLLKISVYNLGDSNQLNELLDEIINYLS